MIITGLLVFIALYLLKLPFYLGIIIVLIGVIFHFSSHRGFTHSILGVFSLAILISLILILTSLLILTIKGSSTNSLLILSSSIVASSISIILLSLFVFNRKLLLIFLPLFIFSLFTLNIYEITYMEVFISLFLGLLSHLILDSFSPSGIKPFIPFSSKKYYKKFGISILIIISLIFIVYFTCKYYFSFILYFHAF